MKMKTSTALRLLPASLLLLMGAAACNSDLPEDDSVEWNKRNQDFVETEAARTENGKPYYTRVSPDWAPSAFVLMHWHNDRSLTASNLQPLDNSTCYVKYELENIDGEKLQDSYSMNTYGDSIYRCRPCENIVGFWTALRNMHAGDSVTVIIPASAGYGNASSGKVKPYSTLVYHLKLKSVPAFEIPREP